MFEHMKNYEQLMHKISTWLRPSKDDHGQDDALLFIHIFCHRTTPYHFEEGDGWMAKTFFSGLSVISFVNAGGDANYRWNDAFP